MWRTLANVAESELDASAEAAKASYEKLNIAALELQKHIKELLCDYADHDPDSSGAMPYEESAAGTGALQAAVQASCLLERLCKGSQPGGSSGDGLAAPGAILTPKGLPNGRHTAAKDGASILLSDAQSLLMADLPSLAWPSHAHAPGPPTSAAPTNSTTTTTTTAPPPATAPAVPRTGEARPPLPLLSPTPSASQPLLGAAPGVLQPGPFSHQGATRGVAGQQGLGPRRPPALDMSAEPLGEPGVGAQAEQAQQRDERLRLRRGLLEELRSLHDVTSGDEDTEDAAAMTAVQRRLPAAAAASAAQAAAAAAAEEVDAAGRVPLPKDAAWHSIPFAPGEDLMSKTRPLLSALFHSAEDSSRAWGLVAAAFAQPSLLRLLGLSAPRAHPGCEGLEDGVGEAAAEEEEEGQEQEGRPQLGKGHVRVLISPSGSPRQARQGAPGCSPQRLSKHPHKTSTAWVDTFHHHLQQQQRPLQVVGQQLLYLASMQVPCMMELPERLPPSTLRTLYGRPFAQAVALAIQAALAHDEAHDSAGTARQAGGGTAPARGAASGGPQGQVAEALRCNEEEDEAAEVWALERALDRLGQLFGDVSDFESCFHQVLLRSRDLASQPQPCHPPASTCGLPLQPPAASSHPPPPSQLPPPPPPPLPLLDPAAPAASAYLSAFRQEVQQELQRQLPGLGSFVSRRATSAVLACLAADDVRLAPRPVHVGPDLWPPARDTALSEAAPAAAAAPSTATVAAAAAAAPCRQPPLVDSASSRVLGLVRRLQGRAEACREVLLQTTLASAALEALRLLLQHLELRARTASATCTPGYDTTSPGPPPPAASASPSTPSTHVRPGTKRSARDSGSSSNLSSRPGAPPSKATTTTAPRISNPTSFGAGGAGIACSGISGCERVSLLDVLFFHSAACCVAQRLRSFATQLLEPLLRRAGAAQVPLADGGGMEDTGGVADGAGQRLQQQQLRRQAQQQQQQGQRSEGSVPDTRGIVRALVEQHALCLAQAEDLAASLHRHLVLSYTNLIRDVVLSCLDRTHWCTYRPGVSRGVAAGPVVRLWHCLVARLLRGAARQAGGEAAGSIVGQVLQESLSCLAARYLRACPSAHMLREFTADVVHLAASAFLMCQPMTLPASLPGQQPPPPAGGVAARPAATAAALVSRAPSATVGLSRPAGDREEEAMKQAEEEGQQPPGQLPTVLRCPDGQASLLWQQQQQQQQQPRQIRVPMSVVQAVAGAVREVLTRAALLHVPAGALEQLVDRAGLRDAAEAAVAAEEEENVREERSVAVGSGSGRTVAGEQQWGRGAASATGTGAFTRSSGACCDDDADGNGGIAGGMQSPAADLQPPLPPSSPPPPAFVTEPAPPPAPPLPPPPLLPPLARTSSSRLAPLPSIVAHRHLPALSSSRSSLAAEATSPLAPIGGPADTAAAALAAPAATAAGPIAEATRRLSCGGKWEAPVASPSACRVAVVGDAASPASADGSPASADGSPASAAAAADAAAGKGGSSTSSSPGHSAHGAHAEGGDDDAARLRLWSSWLPDFIMHELLEEAAEFGARVLAGGAAAGAGGGGGNREGDGAVEAEAAALAFKATELMPLGDRMADAEPEEAWRRQPKASGGAWRRCLQQLAAAASPAQVLAALPRRHELHARVGNEPVGDAEGRRVVRRLVRGLGIMGEEGEEEEEEEGRKM